MPLRHTFIADCETPVSAYLKLRGDGPVVPARVGRAGPARRALVVPRLPAARPVIRAEAGASTRTPTRSWPRSSSATGSPRSRACRRSPAAPSGLFGYDLVRSAEPTRRASPTRRHRHARAGGDGHRRAARLRPPAPRGDGARERRRRGRRRARLRGGRGGDRRRARAPARPGAAAARAARAARVLLEPGRPTATPPPSSAPRSTSAPATSTRWCRASAGRRTARSTRSRSTAACAPSTRAPTCTSSTSRTSRSRAPRPSRS